MDVLQVLTAVCLGISSWALLKVVNLTERVVALESSRTSDKEALDRIEDRIDRIAAKLGVVD